jgi:hypothetical protein
MGIVPARKSASERIACIEECWVDNCIRDCVNMVHANPSR